LGISSPARPPLEEKMVQAIRQTAPTELAEEPAVPGVPGLPLLPVPSRPWR
jgi:hypothetical protein